MSGLSRTPGKRVRAKHPPRVRIPPSPPKGPLRAVAEARNAGEYCYRLIPAAVLLAFTIKVGFKALLMKARGEFKAVHELRALPDALPSGMRAPLGKV